MKGVKLSQERILMISGENSGGAKLNNEKVKFIRSTHRTQSDFVILASRFNVSPDTIRRAYKRKSWKHLQ